MLESLFGGALAVALVTGAVTVLIDGERTPSQRCDNAYEAILDDDLNSALSDEQKAKFLERQLQIAEECGKDDR